jgi:hypothetical protein
MIKNYNKIINFMIFTYDIQEYVKCCSSISKTETKNVAEERCESVGEETLGENT